MFLGGVFPKHLETEIIKNSRGKLDFAANNLQWGIIDGIDLCNNSPVRLCNLMLIGSYPSGYNKIKIRTEAFAHKEGASDVNLGFINLPVIKLFSRLIAGVLSLLSWSQSKEKSKVIIIYEIHTPYLLAARIVKSIYPGIKLCLILPDLPEFMSDSKNPLYRSLKFLDKILISFCLKGIDAFVLLSEFMIEKLDIIDKPWVRMEGIFNSRRYDFISNKNPFKTIMYSGNLNIEQGIIDLLNAFSKIKDENYILWITGDGNGLNEILKASKTDKRITYWSALQQKELFKLHQKSTLLINPLKPNHRKTRYFFPSKTMEYMASGTPTLMYKLPCIPEEYHEYLYFFDDVSAEGMMSKIIEICNKSKKELDDFGMKAKEFILTKKNPKVQCGKIYSMLKELFV
jgi:glycosyltransferase involved in cell wall biosynthesis